MTKGRILLVEPDDDIAHMLRIYLSGQGYKVWMLELGRAISELARELIEPDVLILANDNPPCLQALDHLDMYVLVGKMRFEKQIVYLIKNRAQHNPVDAVRHDYTLVYKPFDIELVRDRIQEICDWLKDQPDG